MKFQYLLPVLPLASALVITEQSIYEKLERFGNAGQDLLASTLETSKNAFDSALEKTTESLKQVGEACHNNADNGYDIGSWLQGSDFQDDFAGVEEGEDHEHPPHHGRPHHPPHHGDPHHGKPNLTIYQLISESKYTTKLAELINEYDDLVDTLNSTTANFTIFAPVDSAFEKIPEHHRKPSKEFLKSLLLYHVSPDLYPARRVLHSYTLPTLYAPSKLGGPQRLTVRVSLRGPLLNFYSKLIVTDIPATNGLVHGIDSILVPPPNVATIINLLPGQFSTLQLALTKTGLFEKMNSTDYDHEGGTLFAPSNFAWRKLGPRANAFLFSKYGEKYLKALLEYHIVVDQTLYTDAFYDATSDDGDDDDAARSHPRNTHYDLPTVLGKHVSVDLARWGPFVEIRINGFSRVTVHDGVASDGVIQVVSDVLIPPKTGGGEGSFWEGEEISVEELKERLEPLMGQGENMEL
ncbi:FAS1 domain-containing protein [Westerdykella ornata]|uniref:FAS1 domain-containing protein n=1 Tax=Westerdykella ornata TaxID=318751 RepID=A0A6A6JM43_WESOR|nr:FAS1 domain-containing protein [Westerdykella ornata]KAF2277661.1 FAS1 domain-containing protein [Westerdykella ornata]